MARRRPRDEDEDDDLDDEESPRRGRRDDDEDEPEDDPTKPKPRNDAYTGMLAISFLALAAAAVLLYLDFSELSSGTLPAPNVTVSALGAPADAPGR